MFPKLLHQTLKSVLFLNFYRELRSKELSQRQTATVREGRAVAMRTTVTHAHHLIWHREPSGIFHRCRLCEISGIPWTYYILIRPEGTSGREISRHTLDARN